MSQIPLRRLMMIVALAAVSVIAAAAGVHYYRYYAIHVSTDDAYVDGNVILITPRVSGTVTAIYVMDNWQVKTGDLLIELDPRDFDVRVDEAQAQLERARQSVDQLFSQFAAAQAGVKLADSQRAQAELDYRRAEQLHASGIVSGQFFDQATTALGMARANRLLAEQEVGRARAALGGDLEDHARYERPVVQQAEAALQAARLDLSYTRIGAPITGIVTRKSVHVGHRVQVGQPLMALVPTGGLYVNANFKETQLTQVRVGQRAEIEADIYPGYVYRAHVDSISMGTGSAFSLLPPENATGNWVKVVQRVPVKVVLDEPPPADKPLRLGLSVEVAIDLSDQRGPLVSSILQNRYRGNGGEPIPPEVMNLAPQPSEAPGRRPGRFGRLRELIERHEYRHPAQPR